ncbi:MAG: dTMP kinase [Aerococcus sp.]|nr:dTMP kinase [Aerococcus sp.]
MRAHEQYPGYFITVEGPDGAGKTTLLNHLIPHLSDQLSRPLITTREPGGVPIAEEIRQMILDKTHTTLDARTEALLYAASRRQHLVEKVLPALNRGEVVLCDRFVDSSVAYQGYGRQLGSEAILSINQFATEGLEPDATIYCDLSAEIGLERIRKHREEAEQNRLDQEDIAFHRAVVSGYADLKQTAGDRFLIVDASMSEEAMKQSALSQLQERFPALFTQTVNK